MALRFFLFLMFSLMVVKYPFGQNPVSPPGIYIADRSARVWNDGRLYIYGSLDESCDYYCSNRHHLLVTSDMKSWQLVEDIFSSAGAGDGVPYNDIVLYAPDAAYRDGTWFLYYCQPDRNLLKVWQFLPALLDLFIMVLASI